LFDFHLAFGRIVASFPIEGISTHLCLMGNINNIAGRIPFLCVFPIFALWFFWQFYHVKQYFNSNNWLSARMATLLHSNWESAEDNICTNSHWYCHLCLHLTC
jgi:hypothetical protein